MSRTSKKVNLLGPVDVDKIIIRRDHYFSNAYVIDFPLDTTPDHVWQDIFEREWKSSRHLWDRKLFVVGDKLRLVTQASDIEDKVDWIKQIMEKANQRIDSYNQEAEVRATEKEGRKRLKPEEEKASIEAIKDIVRKRLETI
jgi:hypothetical protein